MRDPRVHASHSRHCINRTSTGGPDMVLWYHSAVIAFAASATLGVGWSWERKSAWHSAPHP